ncbi:MAG: MucR family transcriptional regulator [Robiginitomaculum sp.]|nr:MAG: MucR family transcriptional regulator [Robiginitomaculum sp.]
MTDKTAITDMAVDIVTAYVGNNSVSASELPEIIRNVYGALSAADTEGNAPAQPPQKPAVSPRRSITPDYIICLEDGGKYKSLKRHLRAKYDMSPDEYRAKWGLASDYPMVAPNYAEARSKLAKEMGLGRGRRGRGR